MPSSIPSSTGSRPRPDRGQATVELALALPVVVLALLLVLQVAVVAVAQVRVEHAAREAGRAAAVGADPGVPAGLDPSRTDVRVDVVGAWVTASVRYQVATDLPLVGPLTPDVVLDATATFRAEVPGP
jgi:hypothetical protein